MEIEYKRELTKSYMCVKTDQDFLPFEKEILTRNSISGILPVNTTFADSGCIYYLSILRFQAESPVILRSLSPGCHLY